MSSTRPTPMLAGPVEAVESPRTESGGTDSRWQAPKAHPDAVLDKIRLLITDDFPAARQMAAEACLRFPKHSGLRNAKRILNDGKAVVGRGGSKPSRHREIAWLRQAPESLRGKWVALADGEMVGAADSLEELARSLRARKFTRAPLVHRID